MIRAVAALAGPAVLFLPLVLVEVAGRSGAALAAGPVKSLVRVGVAR
ncbi:hypothetical protein OG943_16800 [Amycolatopsis sp. NBC_00345]